MIPIWLSVVVVGDNGVVQSEPKVVHSSWPMGLPGTFNSFDIEKSSATMSCDDDVVSNEADITENILSSINGLYMATACNAKFVTSGGQVYERVPMNSTGETHPIYIKTRGASSNPNKRYERNGNVLDIVNVTHRNLNETGNNQWVGFTNLSLRIPSVGKPYLHLPGFTSTSTCKIRRPGTISPNKPTKDPTSPNQDDELLDGFGYLPFWASDNIGVPFCYYKYSADQTKKESENKLLFPDSNEPLNINNEPPRNRRFFSNPSGGFGSLMNMKAPSCSDSSNTMCMPGRCSMLDTNYLFRQSSKEHVFRFASMGTYVPGNNPSESAQFNPASDDPTQLKKQIWAVVVLGRAQCDPMYGGGIVHKTTPDEVKFPINDEFNKTLWTRLSNDGDAFIYTTDPFNDELFMNERGTISGLPTYAFEQWGTNKNPNPKWFFKSEGDWEDGDPSGIRAKDADIPGFTSVPHCGDFKPTVPIKLNMGSNPNLLNSICDANATKTGACHTGNKRADINTDERTFPDSDKPNKYADTLNSGIFPAFFMTFDTINSIRAEISGRGNTEVPLFELNTDQGIHGLNKDSVRADGDIILAPVKYATVTSVSVANYAKDCSLVQNQGTFGSVLKPINNNGRLAYLCVGLPNDGLLFEGGKFECDEKTGFLGQKTGKFRDVSDNGDLLFSSSQGNSFFKSKSTISPTPPLCRFPVFSEANLPGRPNNYLPRRNRTVLFETPMKQMDPPNTINEPTVDFNDFVCKLRQDDCFGSNCDIVIQEYDGPDVQNDFKAQQAIETPTGFEGYPFFILDYENTGNQDPDKQFMKDWVNSKAHCDDPDKIKNATFKCASDVGHKLASYFNYPKDETSAVQYRFIYIQTYIKYYVNTNTPHHRYYRVRIPMGASLCFNRYEFNIPSYWGTNLNEFSALLTFSVIPYNSTFNDNAAIKAHALFKPQNSNLFETVNYDFINGQYRHGHIQVENLMDDNYAKINQASYWDLVFGPNGITLKDETYLPQSTNKDIKNVIRIPNAIPHYYRLNTDGNNNTFFKDWYKENTEPDHFFTDFDKNPDYSKDIKLWASEQSCPIYAGCILRPDGQLSADKDPKDDLGAVIFSPKAKLKCRSFWAKKKSTKLVYAEDPGVALTKNAYNNITNRRYKTNSGSSLWTMDKTAIYSDEVVLEPFTILPPEIGATKYHPQFESVFTTQLTQNFGNPESLACECGGGKGIKFFHVTTPVADLNTPRAFQNATAIFMKLMGEFTSNKTRIKNNFGYRVYAYGWVELIGNAPLVGIPIVSHKVDHIVYERDIFRDPAMTQDHQDGLVGKSAGFPNWGLTTLRHKYWAMEPMQGSPQHRDHKFPYPRVPIRPKNIAQNRNIAESSKPITGSLVNGATITINVFPNDVVCPLYSSTKYGTGTLVYNDQTHVYEYTTLIEGTCNCTSYACTNATGCNLTVSAENVRDETSNNATYTYTVKAVSGIPASPSPQFEIHCFPVWEHQYHYKSSCLRYPWGMVQSWELPNETKYGMFPPPVSLEHQTYNYCEDLNATEGDDSYDPNPVFLDCANDHLGYEKRKEFCNTKINPLVTHTIEALVMVSRGLKDVCSTTLKVCVLVPGTPEYGTLSSLLSQNELSLTGYTILVAPFNGEALGLARAFAVEYSPDRKNRNTHATQQTNKGELTFFGFATNAGDHDTNTYTILAHTEYAHNPNEVIRAIKTFTNNLEVPVSGDGVCPRPGMVRVLADSDQDLAYKCVEKDWWIAPPITDMNMKVRNADITIKAAIPEYPLQFGTPVRNRYGSGCVKFQVGAPGFVLEDAYFYQNEACPDDATGAPIVFSGESAANARVSMSTDRIGGVGAMFLGMDSEFFGNYPTINVQNVTLSVTNSPSLNFSAGFARANGHVTMECDIACEVLVQSHHPDGNYGSLTFTRRPADKVTIFDVGRFLQVYGDDVERTLFSRPVDHSMLAWVLGAIALVTSLVCATATFRISTKSEMRRYIYLKKKIMMLFPTSVSRMADGDLGNYLRTKEQWVKDGKSDIPLSNALHGFECHILEPDFYTRKREGCPMDEPIIWLPLKDAGPSFMEAETKQTQSNQGSYYLAVEFVLASEHGSKLAAHAPQPIGTILERCGIYLPESETKKTR